MIADFDTIEVKSEPEALLLEGKLIKQWRRATTPTSPTTSASCSCASISTEELPRFRLTRSRKRTARATSAPFAHSGLLRKTLARCGASSACCSATPHPQKLPDGTWQLYDDVREELYGRIRRHAEDYRQRVDDACAFLEGKSREWLETLRERDDRRAPAPGVREGGRAARRRVRAGKDAGQDAPLRARPTTPPTQAR
jgi:excinuclease ABC subunit C